MPPKPVLLAILDGFGWSDNPENNAVALARMPNFRKLWANSPHAFIAASGRAVGLPAGQMGNSEVGHLNLGAGRVVSQDLPRIDIAIEDGELAANKVLGDFIAALKTSGGKAHLCGLISPGGVHSHQDHIVALAKILHGAEIPVIIHAWTDGRDVPPESGLEHVQALETALGDTGKIGTLVGRYYAMDRDKRWERVEQAYDLLTTAKGQKFPTAKAAIEASYAAKITDEFIHPAVIGDYTGMQDGDAILCANFRADRVREILTAFVDPKFDGFPAHPPKFSAVTGMTAYSNALAPFMTTLFTSEKLEDLVGGIVSQHGLKQLRIAETEKYPHVTYFFNGGIEEPFPGEDRILIPSPKVATYDLQPEMSAAEVTAKTVAAIDSGEYDLIVLNFANPDMVGHTGFLSAAITALEAVDTGLGDIWAAIERQGGTLVLTADHGNVEQMYDPTTHGPHTAHTTNLVPVLCAGGPEGIMLHDGALSDVAPTLLKLMGLAQPDAMTGQPLYA